MADKPTDKPAKRENSYNSYNGFKFAGDVVNTAANYLQGMSRVGDLRAQRYMTHTNDTLIDMSSSWNKRELDRQRVSVSESQRASVARAGVLFDGSVAQVNLETLYNFEKERINIDIQAQVEKMQNKLNRQMLQISERMTRDMARIQLVGDTVKTAASAYAGYTSAKGGK